MISRFGASRAGDFLLLQKAGAEYGFAVSSTQTFVKAACVSVVPRVRRALAEDNFGACRKPAGTPATISGRVVHGDELGRTVRRRALPLRRQVCSPVKGVYAVEVTGRR